MRNLHSLASLLSSLPLSLLFIVPSCPTDPTDPDPTDPDDPSAAIVVPASSPSRATIDVTWSPGLERKYLHVTDLDGNNFSTETRLDGDQVSALFPLPAGRSFVVEAGYTTAAGERVPLDTAELTTVASGPCDTATLGYQGVISYPETDMVLPAGLMPYDAFVHAFTPARQIPDKYFSIYDETAGEWLISEPDYDLPAGHTFTVEIGWYCLAEDPVGVGYPLAAKRFSTAP